MVVNPTAGIKEPVSRKVFKTKPPPPTHQKNPHPPTVPLCIWSLLEASGLQ